MTSIIVFCVMLVVTLLLMAYAWYTAPDEEIPDPERQVQQQGHANTIFTIEPEVNKQKSLPVQKC